MDDLCLALRSVTPRAFSVRRYSGDLPRRRSMPHLVRGCMYDMEYPSCWTTTISWGYKLTSRLGRGLGAPHHRSSPVTTEELGKGGAGVQRRLQRGETPTS